MRLNSIASRRALPRWIWPTLAVLAGGAPFAAGLSLTNVFYVRDLAMFFWPRHLWIRRALLAGHLPLWDPYAAAGQAAFPDALNQFFLPPVLLLRVLAPAVAGFNLVVAAPFPLAALGAWLFLRRHFSSASAAIAAAAFSVSGPVVSTGNFPNLSWSVAWIPWILWAADRDRVSPSLGSLALVAAMIAAQMLSGEPVTMMATMLLLVAYVVTGAEDPRPIRARLAPFARVAGAVVAAGVISAVQLVPMALAAQASPRGLMRTDNFWSVHPLWLVESVLPHVFGDVFSAYEAQLPWIEPLNSGRDPFFFSIYVGPVVLILSVLGALTGRRRWRRFWLTVGVVGIVLAFGDYTPIYPALQRLVPLVRTFRFPAKFLVFESLALAMLVANAANALQAPSDADGSQAPSAGAVKITVGVGLVAALSLVALVGLVLIAPFTGARLFFDLGTTIGLRDPVAGAAFLFESIPPIATRVLLLLLVSALLTYLGWRGRREGRVARTLLFGLAMAELIAVNAGVNPVISAGRLGPPAWAASVQAHPSERVYFGGKFRGTVIQTDPDLLGVQWRPPRGAGLEELRTEMAATTAMTPAAWGIRELISYDLPQLWPTVDTWAFEHFERAGRADRLRFLIRGGVRYCVLGAPPRPDARPIHLVGAAFGAMAVYECVPDARRAYVVPSASVVPDLTSQLQRLFDESFDANATVMLEHAAPEAAGLPGAPEPPSARITDDRDETVSIDAAAGLQGGYLVLLDSFDRAWHVEVDGRSAPILRANALYRAVHLAPGRHVVRFAYRPTVLYVCAIISGLAALTIAALALKRPPASA